MLQRLADTVHEPQVDAAAALASRLPHLLDAVDQVLLPLAGGLRDVGPELHELLGLVEDLHRTAEGLPGVKLLRRRGSES